MEGINYYLAKTVWQTQPFQQEPPEGEILKGAPGTRVLCWTGLQGFRGTPWVGFSLQQF